MYAQKATRTWHAKNRNGDCCNYQQPVVDSEQRYSKYRYPTHPWSIFIAGWHIYASRIVPASSTKFHDNFTKVMDVVKKYKEDIGIIYMNQDLKCVCDALATRLTNTSQVLVCGDDAHVFILPFFTTYIASVMLSWKSMLVAGTTGDAQISVNWQEKWAHTRVRHLYLLYCGSESTKGCWYLQQSPFLFQVCQVLVTFHAYTGCATKCYNEHLEIRHRSCQLEGAGNPTGSMCPISDKCVYFHRVHGRSAEKETKGANKQAHSILNIGDLLARIGSC